MQYCRAYIPGGSYFFTVVTYKRKKLFVQDEKVALLRQAFRHVMEKRLFYINAAVILPDHLHCVWTLPPGDSDYSTRWRLIKSWVTRHVDEQQVWQPRYWEHLLRDEEDYRRHVEYIHYNPVKHGYSQSPLDWPYSSFQWHVRKGVYPEDWGKSEMVFAEDIGRE